MIKLAKFQDDNNNNNKVVLTSNAFFKALEVFEVSSGSLTCHMLYQSLKVIP